MNTPSGVALHAATPARARRVALATALTGTLLLTAVASSACAQGGPSSPASASTQATRFTRQPQADASDHIAFDGATCTLTITQRFGIGAAQVALPQGCRSQPLKLRFRYAPGEPFRSLEGLSVKAGAGSEPQQADRSALKPTADALGLELPAAWLQGALNGSAVMELAWVDAYRG